MLEELREKLRRTQQDKDVEDRKGTQPKKYYAKDADGDEMSKSTKDKRAAHFRKGGSTEPAPGDKGKKTKPSKYTKKFKKMYGEEEMELDEKIAGLVKKSKQTGVPYGTLKKSYDRGMAAWRTGHRPGTTPQQWAFARVNSMLSGGKADPDLQKIARAAKKRKKASKKEIQAMINLCLNNLNEINFFKHKEKKPIMLENLRNIFYRMELSDKETRILSSVFASLGKKR